MRNYVKCNLCLYSENMSSNHYCSNKCASWKFKPTIATVTPRQLFVCTWLVALIFWSFYNLLLVKQSLACSPLQVICNVYTVFLLCAAVVHRMRQASWWLMTFMTFCQQCQQCPKDVMQSVYNRPRLHCVKPLQDTAIVCPLVLM